MGLGAMVLVGRALQVVVIGLNLALLAVGYFDTVEFFGLIAVVGFGNGLANPSGHAGVMSVNPALAGSAAGLSGAMVLAFGGLFTAVSARLMEFGAPATALLLSMFVISLFGLWAGIAAYRMTTSSASAVKT